MRIRDASHVDVAWAVLIACARSSTRSSRTATSRTECSPPRSPPSGASGSAAYLFFNRVLGKEEDGRYQALRAKWGANANRNFFLFFQFQALFVVFFSLPFAFIALDPNAGFGVVAWIGIALWAIGNAGTIVSDRQLARWRANPANKGRPRVRPLELVAPPELLLRVGDLVRRARSSRPPRPYGWIAWVVPAGLLFLLFRVTGIPATEAQALRSRPDYAEYQQTTSVFVPFPPRRA